ncbi:MAG: VanW family protein [Clostridiales bacterium]|nr:VanW family protein [Clostridiales bacterium]
MGSRVDAPALARQALARIAGPAVRRCRRELQWAAVGRRLVSERSGPFVHVIATHSTPLIRPLAGLEPRLQHNKIVNLRLAAGSLDGLVLRPGQWLSFWRQVGPPTRRRGFVEGLVLKQGALSVGVGGGLCQATNLLYWMTLLTPLTVTERWRHSYDVFPDQGRTQPFGSGATCAWPALDLQILNDTDAPYVLSIRVTETDLEGSWTSSRPATCDYRIEERAHRITHDAPGLYVRHNELWRIATDRLSGNESEQLVAVNDACMMYSPFLPPATRSEASSSL